MSIDTIALFQASDAKQAVDRIWDCAVTMPDALCRVGERFAKRWLAKEWKYDGPLGPDNLVGPGGFSIIAEGRIVRVYHLLRYSTFTQQGEDGRLVLDAFHFLGRVVHSDEMIVMHECLGRDGVDLEAIAESLTKKIGPPALDWAELSNAVEFEPRCWMRLRVRGEAAI